MRAWISDSSDLRRYYKYIKKCKTCGKIYGTDQGEEKKVDTCPLCENKMKQKKGGRRWRT